VDARRPGAAKASRVTARANFRTDCFFMGNLLRSAYMRCAETRNFFLAIRTIHFARDVYEKPQFLSCNLLVYARLNKALRLLRSCPEACLACGIYAKKTTSFLLIFAFRDASLSKGFSAGSLSLFRNSFAAGRAAESFVSDLPADL
jgi:hypothetical protein